MCKTTKPGRYLLHEIFRALSFAGFRYLPEKQFEEMGGSYSEVGGYYLPNLIMPDAPPIGIWGQRHLRWLKQNRRVTYTIFLLVAAYTIT